MIKDKKDTKKSKDVEKILLTYCWGNANAGDKVITKGTILSLRKIFPDAKISIWHISGKKGSTFRESEEYLKKIDSNIELLPNPIQAWNMKKFKFPIISRDSLKSSVPSLIFSNLNRKFLSNEPGLLELANSDLVIFNCGHYFFWDSQMLGRWKKLLDSYPLWLAKRLEIPYGILPHSFGPFEFGVTELPIYLYYKNLFLDADFLFTRESLSKENLKNQFGNNLEIINSIDTGFFVEEQKDDARKILKKHNLNENQFIAMTLRLSKRGSGKKLDQKKYYEYAKKLTSCIEKLINKYDYKIALVCQVPSDKIHSENILNNLPDDLQQNCEIIDEKLEPETLEALYGESKLLIGMRFHSLIFALNVGTPVIGIYYYDIGPKICGLLNDFGWSNFEFNLQKMEVDSLIEQVDKVLDNKEELGIEEKVDKRKQEFLGYLEEVRKNLVVE